MPLILRTRSQKPPPPPSPPPPPPSQRHSGPRAPTTQPANGKMKEGYVRIKLRERRNARRSRAKAALEKTPKYKQASAAKKKKLLDAEYAKVELWYNTKKAAEEARELAMANSKEEEDDERGEESDGDEKGEEDLTDIREDTSEEEMEGDEIGEAEPADNFDEEEMEGDGVGETGPADDLHEEEIGEEGPVAEGDEAEELREEEGGEEVAPPIRQLDEEQDESGAGVEALDMLGGRSVVWELGWVNVDEGYGDLEALLYDLALQVPRARQQGL